MELNAALAAQSYGAARPATTPGVLDGAATGAQTAPGRFAEAFAQTLGRAEEAARENMAGTGDPHALVAALSEAQLAVETTVAVRDRVVEAYLEILRMPV
ncbi:MAG: flagellar hook-basal body complex protein FliE [Pararhodobacter sp.]|nr:flagellar hook-basal body complex protein FliE [Pararhodobacter sp.]